MSFVTKPFRWFWQTRRRNKAIVLILLGIAGFLIYRQISAASAIPSYSIEEAKIDTITQLVSETGNVSTSGRTDVYSPSTGVVEELFVSNTEQVDVGAPLFSIKSTATEAEKATALGTYLNAKNTLETANATLFSLQSQLFAANQTFINGKGNTNDPIKDDPTYVQQNADWLAAEANYKKQQGVISAAQAALTSAALAYQATQNTTVKATAIGTVANLSLSVGDMVTAKVGTAVTAPVLIIVSALSQPTIQLSLNEVDVPKVSTGQTAEVLLDAFPAKPFTGVVKSVDTVGTNTSGVITYNVVVSLDTSDTMVKPGMTANVDIAVDKAVKVLTVPNAAIKPYKGGKAVQVINPKTKLAKFIPVIIGVKSPERTEIKKGIMEGTAVITGIKSSKPAPIQ